MTVPMYHLLTLPLSLADNVGYIVLWSIVEGGIGLIAGSLPMLRQLFQRWIGSTDPSALGERRHVMTIGGSIPKSSTASTTPQRHNYTISAANTRWEVGKWEQLDEDESVYSQQSRGSHNDSAVELNRVSRPEHV